MAGAFAVLTACGGPLGHRSVAEGNGVVAIGPDIDRVRIEIENGSLRVVPSPTREAAYRGGVRRAADTAEILHQLEQVPIGFIGVPDPKSPRTLVLRGPFLPEGVAGVLGMEVEVRLPADLRLDVDIPGSGVIVMQDRAAATTVTTGRGDLRFENCAGGVTARTGRGNVIAFGHGGVLDVQTMAGDMQTFVRDPRDRIHLVTGKGTLQLYVPPTTGFDLDARAETGRINNGFGLTAEKVGDYSAALVARVGDGSTKIVLRSAAGHISFAPKAPD